jgi:hypothetical protein
LLGGVGEYTADCEHIVQGRPGGDGGKEQVQGSLQ